MLSQKSTLSSTPLQRVGKDGTASVDLTVVVVIVLDELLLVVVVASSQLSHMVGHKVVICAPTNGSSHADGPINSH